MSEEIINKVAQSGLLTLDLEDFYPREEIVVFDLKPLLFREMILKEQEFRASLQSVDWAGFSGKILAVTCTAEHLVPGLEHAPDALNLLFTGGNHGKTLVVVDEGVTLD